MAGTWRQEQEQRPWRTAAYCLTLSWLTKDQAKDGPIHNGTSISNGENAPQGLPPRQP